MASNGSTANGNGTATNGNCQNGTDLNLRKSIDDCCRLYLSAKYKYTSDYFLELSPQSHEDALKLWQVVPEAISEMVHSGISYLRQLLALEDLQDRMSAVELCYLVESAFFLLFNCRSAVQTRNDMSTAFDLIFSKLQDRWPEIKQLIQLTREQSNAIRKLAPNQEELSLIFSLTCFGVIAHSAIFSNEVKRLALKLERRVLELDSDRWPEILSIAKHSQQIQQVRVEALMALKQRSPDLVQAMLGPVFKRAALEFGFGQMVTMADFEQAVFKNGNGCLRNM